MQDDNLYPNDGAPFLPTTPTEQKEELAKEKAETLQALPIIQEIIARFEERIAFYTTIDSIPPENRRDEKVFLRMWDANQMARDSLISEKEYLEDLVDRHFR